MLKRSFVILSLLLVLICHHKDSVAGFTFNYRVGPYPTWFSSGITVSMSNYGGGLYWGSYGGYGSFMPYGYSPFMPMGFGLGFRSVPNPYTGSYTANLIRDIKQKQNLTRYALNKMSVYYQQKTSEDQHRTNNQKAEDIQINITPNRELENGGNTQFTPKEITVLENNSVVMKTY